MESAEVAILLISKDFLVSPFIRRDEVPKLLERRQNEGVRVIPLFVRPCAWKAIPWLAAIQGRPKDAIPLSGGTEHRIENDLAELVLEIHEFLQARNPRMPQPLVSETRPARLSKLGGSPAQPLPIRPPKPGKKIVHEKTGIELVFVPGGEYTLGAEGLANASPVHVVRLSPFWIGKVPVTNKQYALFLNANPKAEKPDFWRDSSFNKPRQPVVGVSWAEAQAFCRWAELQLPSEAQWEAAARGTDGRRFPWGNEEPSSQHANFGSAIGRTMPVGAHPLGQGPFGTLDQAGNVAEWCKDVWDHEAYQKRGFYKLDPVVTKGDYRGRPVRGSDWCSHALFMAAAFRTFGMTSYQNAGRVGFRCLLPFRSKP